MKKSVPRKNTEGLFVLFSGIAQDISIIHSADDAIESKTIAMLAGDLIIVTLIFSKSITWNWLLIAGLASIACSTVISLIILWSRSYNGITVDINKHLDYLDKDNESLILQLISDAQKSETDSNRVLTRKASLYQWSTLTFAVGVVISILSFFIKLNL